MTTTQQSHGAHKRRLRWGFASIMLIVFLLLSSYFLLKKPLSKVLPPQSVKVAKAIQGQMPIVLNELGTVTPIATVTVIPNQAVSGYLTTVYFQEGQEVKNGQLLAQIDPRPYAVLKQQAQAQLAKDEATLAQARSDLARYRQLAKQKSIADQTYVDQQFLVLQDEAAVKIDKANIAQYDLDLTYCHITAPVTGRIGLRLVDPGNYITGSSSTGIAVITTIKPTTVEFTVAQSDLGPVIDRFYRGTTLLVTALTSDNSRQISTGTLYAIDNQMATSTGTVTLRASFPNKDEALFPNEFVNIQLLVNTLMNAVLVPTSAIQTGVNGSYVYFVNKNNTVSVQKVTVGPSDGKNTAITDGLLIGDEVVIEGINQLNNGTKINIILTATAS